MSSQRGLILSPFMMCFSMRFFHSAESGLAHTVMMYMPVVGSPTLPGPLGCWYVGTCSWKRAPSMPLPYTFRLLFGE